jgi:hypothetical protein
VLASVTATACQRSLKTSPGLLCAVWGRLEYCLPVRRGSFSTAMWLNVVSALAERGEDCPGGAQGFRAHSKWDGIGPAKFAEPSQLKKFNRVMELRFL